MSGSFGLSVLGVVIAIAVLMFLAYKGWHIIFYSLLASVIVCAFCGIHPWTGVKEMWAVGTGNYVTTWLVLFVGGAIFGKIYQDTGAAASIANVLAKIFGKRNAILPILAASFILTMSGISSFVLIFCIYPIAVQLFAKANMSKRLLPAVFCYCVWTVSTVAPGAAQAPNLIPMQYLGTTATAGLVPGYVFAIVVAVINTCFIMICNKKLTAQGIVFEDTAILEGMEHEDELPNVVMSLIPIVVIILGFNVFGLPAELALILGIVLSVILFFKRQTPTEWMAGLTFGCKSGAEVLINTAVIVGFGAVVVKTPIYDFLINWVSTTRMNPYLLAAIAANVFSLVLGSATSSVNLTMQTLSEVFLNYGAQGYNVGFMHRILSQAAMGLDTLPHCGALLVVFNVCGMNHKLSYKYVGFCTVLCPVFVTFCIQVPLCMLLTHL